VDLVRPDRKLPDHNFTGVTPAKLPFPQRLHVRYFLINNFFTDSNFFIMALEQNFISYRTKQSKNQKEAKEVQEVMSKYRAMN